LSVVVVQLIVLWLLVGFVITLRNSRHFKWSVMQWIGALVVSPLLPLVIIVASIAAIFRRSR
jgi:hypothetical protein